MEKSKDANSTQCSQAVSHPSTNRAQHCLTSVIGRELVYSMWYGRCREKRVKRGIVLMQAALLGCEVRFCQLWNGVVQRGLSGWGLPIGSFAAGWAPFALKFFKLFHFHTGGQFLLPQRAINGKKGIQLQLTSKLDETDVRKGNSRNSRSSETEESQYLSDKRDRLQHVPTVFQLL